MLLFFFCLKTKQKKQQQKAGRELNDSHKNYFMGCSGGNFQIITLFELCTIIDLQLGIKILKVFYGS